LLVDAPTENVMPLTDIEIRNARPREKAYRLADDAGMYLEVSSASGKYWRLKYRLGGKEKRLALGVYPEVSAKEARSCPDEASGYLYLTPLIPHIHKPS
jgi:hypothetical protein